MKTKKIFCGKSNGVLKSGRKVKLLSDISAMMKPVKLWKASGNASFISNENSNSKGDCDGSFHQAVYPLLFIAQCFGVMPVNNISSKCPVSLRFTWKSFRFIFAVFVMLSCGLEALSAISWTFRTHVEFGKMVILVYYITNFMSFFCFLTLANVWPALMMKWHEVEKNLPQMETERKKRIMSLRIRKTAAIILTLSAVEHILSIISSVAVVLDCPRIKNILQAYYVHNFPQVFSFVGYSHLLGIYVKFIHVTSTFVWSYADLFIMVVSQGLSAKFKQINERMKKDKGMVSRRVSLMDVKTQ
jgi:gustatory receptor